MMGFYYTSVFSIVPLGIAYVLMLVFFGLAWWFTRKAESRVVIRATTALVLGVLPIGEELWIAWNFGQACKQAGTFITRKIPVEGFYDDTRSTHFGDPTAQAAESFDKTGYRFLEMKGPNGRVVHIEKSDGTWKATLLERSTARYQFKHTDPINGTPWGHKIIRSGSSVIDVETNEEIARYVSFGRGAPWYFIWLDRPGFACDAPGRWPYTRNSRLVYREALVPLERRK
jgi:hypothetical protein